MEEKFKIFSNGNHRIPQFSLVGVFDGAAAWALVEVIHKESAAERIIVNTNGLTMVRIDADKSCLGVFTEIGRVVSKVFFCGEHARDIAPGGASVIY